MVQGLLSLFKIFLIRFRTPAVVKIVSVAPDDGATQIPRCVQADSIATPFKELLIWYTGHGQASVFCWSPAGRQRMRLQ